MQTNPFLASDKDRASIWEMLIARDIRAFIAEDWPMVEGDFIKESFMGIDGRHTDSPDGWSLAFPDLESYRDEWLRQAAVFGATERKIDAETTLYAGMILRDIEIRGDWALAHKKFCWDSLEAQGEKVPANWHTVYYCRRVKGVWKIAGFTGYLPYATGREARHNASIQAPASASQHKTSGPYSPVLIVETGRLVVISGQASIDMDGNFVGETIEEQTALTLENCRRQLAAAGCGFDKVFKVAVYLKDISDWARFNEVYRKYFHGTMPVRTTVQAGLLGTLLVEIECWAAI